MRQGSTIISNIQFGRPTKFNKHVHAAAAYTCNTHLMQDILHIHVRSWHAHRFFSVSSVIDNSHQILFRCRGIYTVTYNLSGREYNKGLYIYIVQAYTCLSVKLTLIHVQCMYIVHIHQ